MKNSKNNKARDIHKLKAKVDERVVFYISEVINEYRIVLENLAK